MKKFNDDEAYTLDQAYRLVGGFPTAEEFVTWLINHGYLISEWEIHPDYADSNVLRIYNNEEYNIKDILISDMAVTKFKKMRLNESI